MSHQPFRNPTGGNIDRSQPLTFTFDGKVYQGYSGDTLASALMANGVKLLARSFKYHRPRGLSGYGVEESNVLVQLRTGARSEPNIPATRVELYEGLVAESQNRWPSLHFDIGAVNSKLSGLFPSGFYYKTFMWPAKFWPFYEHAIRHIAGMGKPTTLEDPDSYAHNYRHCDVLIAGGGPAGLMAALSAGQSGARVILCDENADFGGMLRGRRDTIRGKSGPEWVADTVAQLAAMENVRLLRRTTAAGYYDHNLIVLDERVADHKATPENHEPRHRIWHVRAKEVVLATGSIERPLVFADNDRPGVMLTSAAQAYANAHGALAGRRAVIFTNNASAYAAAADLKAAGIEVQAIVDLRDSLETPELEIAANANIGVLNRHVVVAAHGAKSVHSVTVMPVDSNTTPVGEAQEILCDVVCLSGGWTPSVHLFSQSRGKLCYDETLSAFVPDKSFQRERSAGACQGSFQLDACLHEGAKAGAQAAVAAGFATTAADVPRCSADAVVKPRLLWAIPTPDHLHGGKQFVDLQNDVTAADVGLAYQEGYRSVEHLKRYTTLGMGTDQGRTSNVNGLAIMAGHRAEAITAVGTTTFRQPFTPIPMGAVAGLNAHDHVAPVRTTPLHHWHESMGSPFAPTGQWLRPQGYPKDGETLEQATMREAKHVREKVGIVDVSTLGKIDVQGPDAIEFLNRIYINNFSNLAVGKCRYGVMLREDGLVDDDGVVTRLAENRYMITTTTTHASAVMNRLEYLLDVDWPSLNVHLLSVTDDWSGIAIAGPHSRTVLTKLTAADLSNSAVPFMGYAEIDIDGVPVRLFRISFSGELAYEINMAPNATRTVWDALLKAGANQEIIPYGLEAMNVLRIEKGHVVGGELNGRTTADGLGFGKMISTKKAFVGKVPARRAGLTRDDIHQLVGLVPTDEKTRIPRGAQLIANPKATKPVAMQGEVTSQCMSPNLGHPIALALLNGGRARHGETLKAHSPITGQTVTVTVTNPIFIDPQGERLRG